MEGGNRVLGLDYIAGRRQRKIVKGQRLKEGIRRTKRGIWLLTAGAASGRLWVIGTCPSITYGGEVYGVNGHELGIIRKLAGAASLPGGGGRSLTWAFRCLKHRKGDPMLGPGIVAAVAWSREVWMRQADLAGVRLAWQYANSTMGGAKRPWARVRGPATATWATLLRLGWRFTSPVESTVKVCSVLNMLNLSPIKVKK